MIEPRRSVAELARRWAPLIAQPILIVFVLWACVGGAARDWRMPLTFSGDGLVFLLQSKTTIDHGWWWTNPAVAAPSELHLVTFPLNQTIDQMVVWAISRFTSNPGLVVALFWISTIVAAGLGATWCLRRLGVSRIGAFCAGTLFALSPMAMVRAVGHLNLTIELVPFGATAALLVMSGRYRLGWRWRGFLGVAVGALLLGLNYAYFAFFAVYLLIVATAVGAWRAYHRESVRLGGAQRRSETPQWKAVLTGGAVCAAAIVLLTLVSLVPNMIAWRSYGQPRNTGHIPAEAEIYGLKIRHLVMPIPEHWFEPFREIAAREQRAQFPLETENQTARLGVVGTIGFLGLLAVLFAPAIAGRGAAGDTIRSAARLALAAVLLATIGGFSSVFSLLVSPEIRGYNRIAIYISFFVVTAVALWIDRATRQRPRTGLAVWALVLTVGIFDQTLPLRHVLGRGQHVVAQEVRRLEAFVSTLESQLPAGSMMFQLPIRPFPVDPGVEALAAYDHLKPYIVGHTLRWSYPAMSRSQLRWERNVGRMKPEDLPRYLASEGFSAIVVDRFGYTPAGAEQTISALMNGIGSARVLVDRDNFLVLDLRPLAGRP